ILQGERNHYFVLMFTATNPQIPCDVCKEFLPTFSQVASSYNSLNSNDDKLFFGIAEFINNKKLFGYLKMKNVPHLWVLPPNTNLNEAKYYGIEDESELELQYDIKVSKHFNYQINSKRSTPLEFAKFISQASHISIQVKQPINSQEYLTYVLFGFAILLIIKKRSGRIVNNIKKGKIWSVLSVLFSICFVSGYMFTFVKNVPFVANNDKKEFIYISGGQSYQFGIEILIVGGVYAILGALVCILVLYIPNLNEEEYDDVKKNTLVLILVFLIYLFYSLLTSIVLRKDSSYINWFTKMI
ncbi:dolichyl-diphosphooligosaccharide--protein glycotransferase ASCRUDRAFT_26618, partial [Ascoidea rubescens DSM 1968]